MPKSLPRTLPVPKVRPKCRRRSRPPTPGINLSKTPRAYFEFRRSRNGGPVLSASSSLFRCPKEMASTRGPTKCQTSSKLRVVSAPPRLRVESPVPFSAHSVVGGPSFPRAYFEFRRSRNGGPVLSASSSLFRCPKEMHRRLAPAKSQTSSKLRVASALRVSASKVPFPLFRRFRRWRAQFPRSMNDGLPQPAHDIIVLSSLRVQRNRGNVYAISTHVHR